MDHVIMVLVWYHICDKRVFQGVHAFCGLSILYTYGLHHSWGVLIMTVTSDTSSFWYIRNLMYRRRYITFLMYQSSRTCSQALCMIQQAIHHGLDVSIQRDTSNLMYRHPSASIKLTGEDDVRRDVFAMSSLVGAQHSTDPPAGWLVGPTGPTKNTWTHLAVS